MFFADLFSQKSPSSRWLHSVVVGCVGALVIACSVQAAPLDDSATPGLVTETPIQLKASRQTDVAIQARLEKLFLTMPANYILILKQ